MADESTMTTSVPVALLLVYRLSVVEHPAQISEPTAEARTSRVIFVLVFMIKT